MKKANGSSHTASNRDNRGGGGGGSNSNYNNAGHRGQASSSVGVTLLTNKGARGGAAAENTPAN